MGIFSELAIDIDQRAEKPGEWAVILSDEKRPATIWRISGKARGIVFLEHGKESRTIPDSDIWVIA